MTKRKLITLIILGAAVLALLALAGSLAQIDFPPGEPFALGAQMPVRPPPGLSGEMSPLMAALTRVMSVVLIALIPFSIFYLIISPEGRRRFLQNLIVLGIFIGIVSLLRSQMRSDREGGLLTGLTGMPQAGEVTPAGPPAEFSGATPDWMIFAISVVLAAFVVLLVAAIAFGVVRHRRQKVESELALVRIAEEAENAITTIEAGGSLRDTVIRCYVEMTQVVREARGIQRQAAVTVQEFEAELTRAGLPSQSVHDLTRLFEEVRYGSKELGAWEGRRALDCLAAIADSCRILVKG